MTAILRKKTAPHTPGRQKTLPGDLERRRRRLVSRDTYQDDQLPDETVGDLTYTGYRIAKGMSVRGAYFRPKIDDPGVLDLVCEGLIMGKGLYEVCEDRRVPSYKSIYKAMAKDPDGLVARRIMQARDQQQDAVLDLIRSLTDSMNDANYSAVSQQIRNLQWLASKLAPKRYGEKADPSLIDNRRQVIINITEGEYREVKTRLLSDV